VIRITLEQSWSLGASIEEYPSLLVEEKPEGGRWRKVGTMVFKSATHAECLREFSEVLSQEGEAGLIEKMKECLGKQ